MLRQPFILQGFPLHAICTTFFWKVVRNQSLAWSPSESVPLFVPLFQNRRAWLPDAKKHIIYGVYRKYLFYI